MSEVRVKELEAELAVTRNNYSKMAVRHVKLIGKLADVNSKCESLEIELQAAKDLIAELCQKER